MLVKQNPTNDRSQLVQVSCTQEAENQMNTLKPRQNLGHFADDMLKYIFAIENFWDSDTISLQYAPYGVIGNKPALVQIMAWWRYLKQ